MTDPSADVRQRLRVGFVAGVTVTKWRRIWAERFPRISLDVVEVAQREQRAALAEDQVELCFVRLPIDREQLHVIPLYEEIAVVVARKDHPIAVFDEVTLGEISDEAVIEHDHPDAMDLVAGGAGVMLVPQSIARSESRRDLVYRPLTDGPPTQIGLAWLTDNDNPLIEDFIGIVRGRTPNSSRSRTPTAPAAAAPRPKPVRTGERSSQRRRPPRRSR
jgi:DNA-binding transcriptional LysR family regulator